MFAWLRNLVGTRPPASVGARGERLAANFLRARGYKILERNLSLGDDEADLVALDPDEKTIVIVEVKTRETSERDGWRGTAAGGTTCSQSSENANINAANPELAVTRTKQFHISRLAARLQQTKKYKDHPFRFDVVAVVVNSRGGGEPTIRHIPGAFQSPW